MNFTPIESVYTGDAAQEIDRIAINEHGVPAYSLMEKAGQAAFSRIEKLFSQPGRLLIVCGSGNNGGDGYVVARCALRRGWHVDVWQLAVPTTESCRTAHQAYVADGGVCQLKFEGDHQDYSVVVDAMLGVGLRGAPRGLYADAINLLNQMNGTKIALDVPSGTDANTGHCYSPCFEAHYTYTFIMPKLGLFTGAGTSAAGVSTLDDLDLKLQDFTIRPSAKVLAKPSLPIRKADTHKGRFGSLGVIGGNQGMLGAALMCGRASLRSGVGKATLLSTSQHLDASALNTPELMSQTMDQNSKLAAAFSALAIGPGLGQDEWSRLVFDNAMESNLPCVIDADAINLLAQTEPPQHSADWVLTPHPAEAARLLQTDSRKIQENRLQAATEISRRYQCACVLKGAGTIITPDITAENINAENRVPRVSLIGNPGMATAGMGDVLTGVIAALLAQGWSGFDAACAGTWIHSTAADHFAQHHSQASMMASDVIEALSVVFSELENHSRLGGT